MKKNGKQQSHSQPPSLNRTYRHHEPIEAGSTCRIGVCGFRTCGTSQELTYALKEAALNAFGTFAGPKLLLLAGSLHSWPTSVNEIRRIARAAHVPILFECEIQGRAAYMAVPAKGRQLPLKIYQLFIDSNQANREPGRVEELIGQCKKDGKRTIHISGITLGLLVCGENNVLANKQGDTSQVNRAYVRGHDGSNLFRHLRLIFNGAHTKMGEFGKLKRRFEFLSSGRRWALYATNNKRANSEKEQEWGVSTLQAYYNGSRIATSEGPDPNCKVPTSIFTSGNDQCRILTLDIAGHLLR
jgi:hypothetical protein